MKLKLTLLAILVAALVTHDSSARAEDPAAAMTLKIFSEACIPNMGSTEGVRAWAESRSLHEITNPTALAMFVGAGSGGNAWAMPTPVGNFALSIRAQTKGCVVWAQRADPAYVERYFRLVIVGAKRPGLIETLSKDETVPTPAGNARTVAYTLHADGARGGFVFLMLTAEHAGGPFQAELEVARTTVE